MLRRAVVLVGISLMLPLAADAVERDVESVPVSGTEVPALTHEIPVTMIIIKRSGWSREVVEARATKIQEILSGCGVVLEPLLIVEADSPAETTRFLYAREDSNRENGLGRITSLLRPAPGPLMFYIDAFADNVAQPATSRPPFEYADTAEVNTVWITNNILHENYQEDYNTDAHELVHLLANTGHSVPAGWREGEPRRKKGTPRENPHDGGLMAGNPRIRNNQIDPELCEQIKSHPAAHLLSR